MVDTKVFTINNNYGNPLFIVTYNEVSKTNVSFSVEEIISWNTDNTPCDKENYLEGFIKWDSCSHFWFKGADDDSYYHLCGVSSFKEHIMLLEWLYKKSFELMGKKPENGQEWY